MSASVWVLEVPDMCGESYEVVSIHKTQEGAMRRKEEEYADGWGRVKAVISEYTLHE